MQSRTPNGLFSPNFNLGVDSVFTALYVTPGNPTPPPGSSFIISEISQFVITEDGNRTITE